MQGPRWTCEDIRRRHDAHRARGVSELNLPTCFDGRLSLRGAVTAEVTTQPARGNLRQFGADQGLTELGPPAPDGVERARELLGEDEDNGDVAVVSDDRRVRTVTRGLGATVTGTVGVVVRAVAEGDLTVQEAKALVRRLDSRGLHVTGELREKADELIADAARENGDED